MTSEDILRRGRMVLRLEAEALSALHEKLDEEFVRAVNLIVNATGRLIVSGVGKSGIVARKIAATFTSTGTPASFLHPVESLHGDLGIVRDHDVAILLSKSGESDELLNLLTHLKRFGVATIAITGNAAATLGRDSDVVLDASVREEACPHDLAPTTSTTAALALGDALAVAVLEEKGFKREDFARIHPGGSLGRRLLLRVKDVMETDRLPLLAANATIRDAVVPLARRRGIVVVIDGEQRILGVFTAGDLTRVMEHDGAPLEVRVADVMTRTPRIAQAEELASAVVYRMQQIGIIVMPVTDSEGRVVGVVHLHDLMRAGVA